MTMPRTNTRPTTEPRGAGRLHRWILPLPGQRPISPVLLQHAGRRAEYAQNRLGDAITAFAGSMMFVYIHVLWFGCWIGFGVEEYPFGLLTMIVSLEAIFQILALTKEVRGFAGYAQQDHEQNEEMLSMSRRVLALTEDVHKSAGADSGARPRGE